MHYVLYTSPWKHQHNIILFVKDSVHSIYKFSDAYYSFLRFLQRTSVHYIVQSLRCLFASLKSQNIAMFTGKSIVSILIYEHELPDRETFLEGSLRDESSVCSFTILHRKALQNHTTTQFMYKTRYFVADVCSKFRARTVVAPFPSPAPHGYNDLFVEHHAQHLAAIHSERDSAVHDTEASRCELPNKQRADSRKHSIHNFPWQ